MGILAAVHIWKISPLYTVQRLKKLCCWAANLPWNYTLCSVHLCTLLETFPVYTSSRILLCTLSTVWRSSVEPYPVYTSSRILLCTLSTVWRSSVEPYPVYTSSRILLCTLFTAWRSSMEPYPVYTSSRILLCTLSTVWRSSLAGKIFVEKKYSPPLLWKMIKTNTETASQLFIYLFIASRPPFHIPQQTLYIHNIENTRWRMSIVCLFSISIYELWHFSILYNVLFTYKVILIYSRAIWDFPYLFFVSTSTIKKEFIQNVCSIKVMLNNTYSL